MSGVFLHSRRLAAALGMTALALAPSACGTVDQVAAPAAVPVPQNSADVATPALFITEVMADPNVLNDTPGEWFEVFNAGATAVNLRGWQLRSGSGATGTEAIILSATADVFVPAGGYLVLGRSSDATANGGVTTVGLVYGTITLGNNNTDWIQLRQPDGAGGFASVDSISFGNRAGGTPATGSPPTGKSRVLPTNALRSTAAGRRYIAGAGTIWVDATDPVIGTNGAGSPGTGSYPVDVACTPGAVASITITPGTPSTTVNNTVALAAKAYDAAACEVPGTAFTWSSLDQGIATVASTGVVTGVTAGSARIQAQAANGVSAQVTVTVTDPAQRVPASIDVRGPTAPQPRGTTAQLTARVFDASNVEIVGAPVTWSTTTPSLASINASGVATLNAPGRAVFVGTTSNGHTDSWFIDITGDLTVTSFRSGALPIGFQDILNVRDAATGTSIISGLTFSSSAPAIVSVETDGTISALALGSATITVTQTSTGKVGVFSASTVDAAHASPSIYGNHLEFGTPTDATPADEHLITRYGTYATSYNAALGQPNWVAYNLDGAHHGTVSRCDCFTHDPQLPGTFTRISSAEYLSSGYSRGHMVMSADRDIAQWDNATTYYFTNIIPQTAANNEGPWGDLEQYLGGQADAGKEVYIISGGAKHQGTLKGLGHVAIPTRTWKVAVLMPKDQGLAQATSAGALQVIAVDMPNTATMPSANWMDYRVSVDSVEKLTGYDLLSLLPDAVEAAVENGAPTAQLVAPVTTVAVNQAVTVQASFSDAGTGPWRLVIDWGDGSSFAASLPAPIPASRPLLRQKSYAQPGAYLVKLTITDPVGAVSTSTVTITVQ